jgi:SNF2 family DNA or RNA helicase
VEEQAKKEIPLWAHQTEAVAKARRLIEQQTNCLALFMEVGTGKTPTAVHILRHIYNTNKAITSTLIFAPPVVLRNWRRELLAHSKIPPERIFILTGSGVKRLETLKAAHQMWGPHFIAITNYESVQMGDLFHELAKWMPKVLICDESHRMKNPTAVRTKKVTLLADMARYRYLLTGTPVLNDPLDLFAQLRILDGGRLFGKNFYAFRNQYFYDKNAGMPKQKYFPNFVIKKDSTEKIGRMLESISFQAKKSECLTLPPLVRQRVEVELSKEQAKAYKEMLDEFITFVNDTACVAELAITRTLRLQQILAGYARNEDGKDLPFEGVPRLAALSDLLEDIAPSEKVIVWANFTHTYRQIGGVCEELKLAPRVHHGRAVY